ncbi:MAG: glycoside hydrolase family 31 protein [Verrucomicrobiota bacterium]
MDICSQKQLLVAIGEEDFSPVDSGGEINVPAGTTIRFDLASGGHWYGQGFASRPFFPLERGESVNESFAVGNTQSPIWMCSAGYAILAEMVEPLSLRFNVGGNNLLELRCDTQSLVIRIFHAATLPAAQQQLMKHLGWPNKITDPSVFGDAFFTTWTQYPRCIMQERVVGMAREIRENGYPCSTLIIDDRWESSYGSLTFSSDFPDPKAMMDELHGMGFRVILWTTPFVNVETEGFEDLAREGVVLRDKETGCGGVFKWWGGQAGLIDVTGPTGRDWLIEKLEYLKDGLGVDGFKIDGGDAVYMPPPDKADWAEDKGPSGYVDELLSVFEEASTMPCPNRTAWLSQGRSILWNLPGRDPHWGINNGLKSLVPVTLHMALIGYDILLPGIVGGRMQTADSSAALPMDEMMVRWAEIHAFMPTMQFSYWPWNYASPAADVIRQYAGVHKALEPYIFEQAKDRTSPLLRPIWYDAPEVEELYLVDDEFMLGSDLLVAPVLDPDTSARDILLPPGSWRDAWTGELCRGKLSEHPAPCPGCGIFVREGNVELSNRLHEKLSEIQRGSVLSGTESSTYESKLDRDVAGMG